MELTAKRMPRYASIFAAYRRRLDYGDGNSVTYLCTDAAARAVRQALLELPAGRAIASHVVVQQVFDDRGYWDEETLPSWLPPVEARSRF